MSFRKTEVIKKRGTQILQKSLSEQMKVSWTYGKSFIFENFIGSIGRTQIKDLLNVILSRLGSWDNYFCKII